MDTIRILSTKKLTAAQQELLLNKGFSLVHADFIKIDFLDIAHTPFNNNTIITSKNGVLSLEKNGLLAQIANTTIYCVGSKTQQLLEAKQLTVAKSFANAKELGQYLVANAANQAFTYFCGNIRRKELPNMLHTHNITLQEVVAYKTLFAPQKIQGSFNGVLFFSPSLAESYFFSNTLNNATAFCIGKTTEEAVKPHTNQIITATKPTIENVIVQVVKHFNKETA